MSSNYLFGSEKDTRHKVFISYYHKDDENLKVREINKFGYEIGETIHNHKNSVFRSSL